MPPEDPNYSALDANTLSEAFRRALQIKGVKGAPGQVNVFSVQPTADIIQGGFALYEKINGALSVSLAGNPDLTQIVFSPLATVTALDNKANNRDFEIRLLMLECQIKGLTTANGYVPNDRLYMDLNLKELGTGPGIDGTVTTGVSILNRFQTNLEPDSFFWHFPSARTETDNDDASSSNSMWDGWVTAGTEFSVTAFSDDRNFPAGSILEIGYQAVRVPKGCFLPK